MKYQNIQFYIGNRFIISEENVVWPNGLTIDSKSSRVFWCDSFLNRIESIKIPKISQPEESSLGWTTVFNMDRKVHLSSTLSVQGLPNTYNNENHRINHPYGLALYKDTIYWSEFESGHIMSLDLKTNATQLLRKENPKIFSLKVYAEEYEQQQRNFKSSHPCQRKSSCQADENALCLVTPHSGFSCVCREGYSKNESKLCEKISGWKPLSHCREGQFQCLHTLRCIDKRYTCDGEDDCGDGSDEDLKTTCENATCSQDQFPCDKTRCIPQIWKCDGDKDCSDGTDESFETCKSEQCSPDKQFSCKLSGKCIPKSWVCDADNDCGEGDNSDEQGCTYSKCLPLEFSCSDNKKCIPMEYWCDGVYDCFDKSDETSCEQKCNGENSPGALGGGKHMFYCNQDNLCIPKEKLCDGKKDCSDGADEPPRARCNLILHQQNSTHKVDGNLGPEYMKCRGVVDTQDDLNEFRCSDGNCIPSKFKCDGRRDCIDGSDESSKECGHLVLNRKNGSLTTPFKEPRTTCVYPSFQCDFKLETKVSNGKEHILQVQNRSKCLSVDKLCDTVYDCEDGTDESMRCSERLCEIGASTDCSHFCHNSPDGHRCYCPPDMRLTPQSNWTICTEEVTCESWGSCSQLCKNVEPKISFTKRHKCHCYPEYFLEPDGFTCKIKDSSFQPLLVYTTRTELQAMHLRGSSVDDEKKSRLVRTLATKLQAVAAVDFYFGEHHSTLYGERKEDQFLKNNIIFWADIGSNKIFRGTLLDKGLLSDILVVVESGIKASNGLAVDWIGQNLYWIDSNLNQIEVANFDGSYRHTLISNQMESAHTIVLDPREALMFLTNWIGGVPRIESSDMSGNPSSRKIIHSLANGKDGSWPNGLALDYVMKRLLWTDARSDSIHSCKYDGADERKIWQARKYLTHPFSLTVFENMIYWTDWRATSIVRANKWNGTNVHVVDRITTGQPSDIRVVHPSRQPGVPRNDPKLRCAKDNGACSHLCLISNSSKGYSCACPKAMKLSKDGADCVGEETILLFSRPNEIRGLGIEETISLRSQDGRIQATPSFSIPISSVNPTNLDIDIMSSNIYWLDNTLTDQQLIRIPLKSTGTSQENETGKGRSSVVLDRALIQTESFGLDWYSRNVYFSTNLRYNVDRINMKASNIFVASLNSSYMAHVVWDNPGIILGVVVDVKNRLIYWNDKSDIGHESIKRAEMNGDRIEELEGIVFDTQTKHNPESRNIKCLSLYTEVGNSKLIWINENLNFIQYYSLKEKKVYTVQTAKKVPILGSLTVSANYIYFSEHYQHGKNSILHYIKASNLSDVVSKWPLSYDYKENLSSNAVVNVESRKLRNVSRDIFSLNVFKNEDRITETGNSCSNGNGGCDHICILTNKNTQVCKCTLGFRLDDSDNKSCVEESSSLIVFTSRYGLSGMTYDPNEMPGTTNSPGKLSDEKASDEMIFNLVPKGDMSSFDISSPHSLLFWVDRTKGCIYRINRDGSGQREILKKLLSPQRISVDSISKRIYWTDDESSLIELANFNGKERYVVASENIHKPFAIAVDAVAGYLFWSDNGPSPTIEQSGMDGMDRNTIVSTHLKAVTSLSIDSVGKRLFWCDIDLKTLNMVKYDGSMRRSLLHTNSGIIIAPYSLVFVDRYLYWIDTAAHGGSIAQLDTRGTAKITVIKKKIDLQSNTLKDIKYYKSKPKNIDTNLCSVENGGCEQLCTYNGIKRNVSCLCYFGRLSKDNQTCEDHDSVILFSSVSNIESLHMFPEVNTSATSNPPFKPIQSDQHLKNVIGLAYDLSSSKLFYSDIQENTINEVGFDGSNHRVLFDNVGTIEGMSYDANHEVLYWTSSSKHSINKANFKTDAASRNKPKKEAVLLLRESDKPRGIDIDPCEKKIYFTNWNAESPCIQRCSYTGYGVESIVTTDIR